MEMDSKFADSLPRDPVRLAAAEAPGAANAVTTSRTSRRIITTTTTTTTTRKRTVAKAEPLEKAPEPNAQQPTVRAQQRECVYRPLPPRATHVWEASWILPGFTSAVQLVIFAAVALILATAAVFLLWPGVSVVPRSSWSVAIPAYYASVTLSDAASTAFQRQRFDQLLTFVLGLSPALISSADCDALWLTLVQGSLAAIAQNASLSATERTIAANQLLTTVASGAVASLRPGVSLSPLAVFSEAIVPTTSMGVPSGAVSWDQWPLVVGLDALTMGS